MKKPFDFLDVIEKAKRKPVDARGIARDCLLEIEKIRRLLGDNHEEEK